MRTETKPNFFIVGAAKSGTTSLYHFLDEHPDVYMSPIKEPHFFSKDIKCEEFREDYKQKTIINLDEYFSRKELEKKHIAYIENYDDYLKLFRDVKHEKRIGEISNGYLYSQVAAQEIYNSNPTAKIIIILRNPVERAFSHWLMGLKIGLAKNKDFFKEVLNDYNSLNKGWGISHTYIELGLYYEQVKRYFDIFPEENIKIFLFEELKNKPLTLMNDLYEFLDLPICESINSNKKYNETILPKNRIFEVFIHNKTLKYFASLIFNKSVKNELKKLLYSKEAKPKLSDIERLNLIPYFIEDVQKLERLINKDLSHWYNVNAL
jgi:hypothetical protein